MGWSEQLSEGSEAHVWTVRVEGAAEGKRVQDDCLSEDERLRAERVAAPSERQRFSVTRRALRRILARYMDAPAEALRIELTPGGKPAVEGGPSFSVTHSGALALIAIAATPVGVDVERVRSPRSRRVLLRIFHPDTVATLDRLDGTRYDRAFTRAWTQREAHVKAEGGGLFRTPDTLPFDDTTPEHTLQRVLARDGRLWTVSHWTEEDGMLAAVVAEGPLERVVHRVWAGDV